MLRGRIQSLRAAAADKVADAELINGSLEVELQALQAVQESEKALLDGIIAELAPLMEEDQNA